MLSEKQLLELIKALQSSHFSTFEILFLCLGVLVAAIVMSYIISVFTESGKIDASNANYKRLLDQLSINTTTVKNIEKTITSELWISQQVWHKKYELYEHIYSHLLNIKKWVDSESEYVELHMLPQYMEGNYQPYFTADQEREFWKEIEEARDWVKKALNDEDRKKKNKELQNKLSEAMTALAEMLIVKSIILDVQVVDILKQLINDIGHSPAPLEYEDPSEYGQRIELAISTALEHVRLKAVSELNIAR